MDPRTYLFREGLQHLFNRDILKSTPKLTYLKKDSSTYLIKTLKKDCSSHLFKKGLQLLLKRDI